MNISFKVMTSFLSLHYRRGQEATKAVDIRAGQLHQSYVAKARATDRAYCGTAEGTVGPVERKLASMGEVEGLVVGAFGEVSAAAALGRRSQAAQLEHLWSRQRKAHALCVQQGSLVIKRIHVALFVTIL